MGSWICKRVCFWNVNRWWGVINEVNNGYVDIWMVDIKKKWKMKEIKWGKEYVNWGVREMKSLRSDI